MRAAVHTCGGCGATTRREALFLVSNWVEGADGVLRHREGWFCGPWGCAAPEAELAAWGILRTLGLAP